MPMFSQDSFSKLSTCHPDLQTLFFEVVRHYDCKVMEGFRNEMEQQIDYDIGATKLQWPDGKHNAQPSMAVDVAPFPISFSENHTNMARFYLFAGFVMGIATQLKTQGKMTYSIRWGGDWDSDRDLSDQKFNDLVHFELL